ncbi:MAG: transglycosylase domain-containing protein [Proteobacteria bacterium]|nr:transglycosylase domain-containing protein [Pseudomonadota bacterium]MBU1686186.1 transglycosylase domain-containing protein [Pseudomonadota bacterium]
MLKRICFLGLGLGAIVGLTGVLLFAWLVVFAPGDEIRQESIEKILGVESPVYYRNGIDKMGVFFETDHRQYIPYERIPQDFVNGIVAAEDRNFFKHYGIDVIGVLRAMVVNLRAGRVVQGGSTLTQQTAKNLFKRQERSISAKLKELLYAMRLEYHYPKEKILEFYVNQFYVSGNGRGLGVAACYYFDKDVSELSLLECAFIAGSVKRPNYYNPFIKKDDAASAEARRESLRRVNYVLKQMYRNHTIDAKAYDENLDREIPFRQGRMYFSLNTIMDLVKEAMASPALEEAFLDHGIDNVATSGIKVITSVEKDLQEQTYYALRKELSRLDVRLLGYDRKQIQRDYPALAKDRVVKPEPLEFLFGRVVSLDEKLNQVKVAFTGQSDDGLGGVIDEKGMMNLLNPLAKYEGQRWSTAGRSDLPGLFARFRPGDLVYVSVRTQDPETGRYHLDLEKYPTLQGGMIAMREGTIRAMVGGMENRYYNRAISAKRPMGSVMKPIVYAAALQLGWNSVDLLQNERDVFVFQNRPYFPRPDHKNTEKLVSMSWAGVKSENLATVWLLYHLGDKLTPIQFRTLLGGLDLDRHPAESASGYQRRIRDRYGIVVNDEVVARIAFEQAVAEIEPDLIFSGHLDEYEILSRFHYGNNFETYLEEVDKDLSLEGDAVELEEEEGEVAAPVVKDRDYKRREAEAKLRKTLLKRNFIRAKKLRDELRLYREGVSRSELATAMLYHDRKNGRYVFTDDEEPEASWEKVEASDLPFLVSSLAQADDEEFWDGILIDNLLSVSTVDLLQAAVDRTYAKLRDLPRYEPEILHAVPDFRVMASLQYLIGFCRSLGIESPLEPVLSFPLGSNVISLLELARAYETMVSGDSRRLISSSADDGLGIIEKILDSDGQVIFEPKRETRKVLTPEISMVVSDILRKVVTHGTGRYADRVVRLHSRERDIDRQLAELDLNIPMLGKTGTANRFTNASFAGVVPGMGEGKVFTLEDGYVLTSYVGFDDNTPMVRNTTHISGAEGALPMWSMVAEGLLRERNYAARLDLVDLSFSGISRFPLHYPELGQVEVPVVSSRGGVVTEKASSDTTIISFGEVGWAGRLEPARFFAPYWQN